ncbi:gamma-aminobutyric acid receptor exp-1-like [Penaeus monodon]|uniref:gamma-aminobutyric acid receptor exp-1-like n=1 Tax=Penaeus monodon TaxID=6687 RepID=UPI0018A71ADF|nr:gamma-aminobutyric acid receptor exp-1-like [Penaeus monodon]
MKEGNIRRDEILRKQNKTGMNPTHDTLYSGANTTLTLTDYVLQPIDCDFDLSFYPFDVHECILPMVLVPHAAKHARLVIGPSSARYTGQVGLKDFSMDKVKVESRDATMSGVAHSGVVLRLQLSRRPAYQVLAVILPSFILLAISTTSLWMSCTTKTPSRLIVSCCVTGAFLLLWAISALTSPSTGRVKALDVWLCFCTMHALLHDITHVAIDIFSGRDCSGASQLFSRVTSRPVSKMREVKPIESGSIYDSLMMRLGPEDDHWTAGYWITFIARVVSPVLVILFNATFWPFVLYFNINPLP